MARSIDEYLKKNPEHQMVIIAGLGHIAYGSGIPKRVFRKNGHSYATILNDVDVERHVADYLVFPQPLDGLTAPKLMAMLKESGGAVSITGFPEGSISKKAGIKEGDILLALDNEEIRSVDDLKIALFYKKKEDTIKIRVLRKRFLLGPGEKEFMLTLP
jgi:aminopeptidase N